jgi:hypothetical protein
MPIPCEDAARLLQKRLEKPNRSRVAQKYASNWADVRCGVISGNAQKVQMISGLPR